jgi:hypothetical protein
MQNIPGKKLFNDHSSSEDEDSISKSRLLGLSREESKGQTKTGNSVGAVDNISASRTSGISY